MTAALPVAALAESAWAEAVAVLANMTVAALKGGGNERRNEDHQRASVTSGGGLSAAVVDGAGPGAHRVHDAPVRAGQRGGPAGLGPPGRDRDRHRSGGLGPVGRGPGGVH